MYEFIKIQYKLGKLTEEQVRALAPKWITTEQVQNIIDSFR